MNLSKKLYSFSIGFILSGSIAGLSITLVPPVASAQSNSEGRASTQPVLLRNPGFDGWEPEFHRKVEHWRSTPKPGYTHLVLPKGFGAAPNQGGLPIFDNVEKPRKVIGRAGRGVALSARRVKTSIRCSKGGVWYAVEGGGKICSSNGYNVVELAEPLVPAQKLADVEATIPFEYSRVITSGAARIRRRPTPTQWQRLQSVSGPKNDPTGLLVERMVGDFFVSLDKEVTINGKRFMRTVRNEFIDAKDLKVKPAPVLRGERLRGNKTLPLAFVYGEDLTEVLCEDTQTVCGVVEKHARFKPRGVVKVRGETYLRGPDNILIPRSAIRLARKQTRPSSIGLDEKWIHVNLAEQNVVAYEGDKPVYTALISSGKKGYDTPTGLYSMQRKFISKTMRAVDAIEGLYHIEDIPYIMSYHGGYAMHGAFWHNTFGEVRSHGCTNLPPADARWLFFWSQPDIPDGWRSVENISNGTRILITNKTRRSS